MACKSICHRYEEKGIEARDWEKNPELMRCTTCGVVLHRKYWIVSDAGRAKCICCKHLLASKSGGKVARENRWKEFLEKSKEIENPSIIKLTDAKASYIKHLIKSYMEIRFHSFDMFEIASYSLRQWAKRIYPIPENYMITNKRTGSLFAKIPKEMILRNKIIDQNQSKRKIKLTP